MLGWKASSLSTGWCGRFKPLGPTQLPKLFKFHRTGRIVGERHIDGAAVAIDAETAHVKPLGVRTEPVKEVGRHRIPVLRPTANPVAVREKRRFRRRRHIVDVPKIEGLIENRIGSVDALGSEPQV